MIKLLITILFLQLALSSQYLRLVDNTCTDANCLQCSTSPDTCTQCKPDFFVKSGACTACSQNCAECVGETYAYCNKCADGYTALESGCGKPCPEFCQECDSDGTCTKCQGNITISTDKTCVSNCVTSQCVDCSGGPNQCRQCAIGYYSSIQQGSAACLQCIDNCQQCTGENQCTECNSGLIFQNGACIQFPAQQNCINIYYPQGCRECLHSYQSNGQYDCIVDPTFCKTSSDDKMKCTECQDTYYLVFSQCYLCSNIENCSDCTSSGCQKCNNGYGLNGPYECDKCSNNCTTCTNLMCTECSNGYQLMGGNCTCSDGFYVDKTDNTCKACIQNCQQCGNTNSCIECNDGFQLSTPDSKCTTCLPKYFMSQNQCLKCISNCTTCEDSLSCKKCDSGYKVKDKVCVKSSSILLFSALLLSLVMILI